ncbi:helicase-exonuclease AddAB subunit AddA [Clostridium pasteurianum]|uniref:ATP-dependent helicase/nuclease subunit A n=1 Tax=Clostridium pasteurianum BC1 TaxID=86416 RepID=R4KC55_CLOPA|nr:helicase-exonuclease AddAB subunit AddA [Clostridium pasteurianum]AGK97205.1 recombination helicase AddA [Clostridium pasteurianum BC1]
MGNNWTEEQREAIETRGCNLLVAAAAGAGKTAVLVERIIKMITDKEKAVDIDRLLVVTFTNAAAAEMRERIGNAISRELFKNPESKLLQRQLVLLNKARITTIHSFCLDIIRNYFHLIDLDPKFRIADETEAVLLKNETIEELFDKKYEESDKEEFLNLVECYCSNRDDSALMEMVLSLYNFAKSSPWPKQWLQNMSEAFNIKEDFDFGSSIWAKSILSNVIIELTGINKVIEKALTIINNENTLEPYAKSYEEDLAMINDLVIESKSSWNSFIECLSSVKFPALKRCGKDVNRDKKDQVQKIRDKYKKQIKDMQEEILSSTGDTMEDHIRELYPIMKCLGELVIEFDREYIKKKRSRGIIDFNDFEHLTLQILTDTSEKEELVPSKAALELREKYEEILIDEYQDSNLVQEVILNSISRNDSENPNLFMVGDVKQSIYRFRQAKPELFLDKYINYSSESGAKNRKILLFKNFRSRKVVVDGANYIFKAIMSENIGELNYDEREELKAGAEFSEVNEDEFTELGVNELHIIEKSKVQDSNNSESDTLDDEEEENIDNIRLEARMVASKIKELIDKKDKPYAVFDKNIDNYRSIQYKDIVILLRATAGWSPTFTEELKAFDIPVFADTGSGYFETTEIKTIISLLQIVDNPLQDIAMLSVLRSPIASFTDEDLIDIRSLDRSSSFYELMKLVKSKYDELCTENNESIYAKNEGGSLENLKYNREKSNRNTEEFKYSDEDIYAEYDEGSEYVNVEYIKVDEEKSISKKLAKKCYDFVRLLKGFRDLALHMPIDEFIWHLYTETGYYSYAGAMPGGVQRQANLRILFQRAKAYENTSYKGLFNFINFINRLKISSKDMGSAKILGENENVVRIMSIHKSKGLEFPVVILAACGKNFNLRDMTKTVLFHHDLGIGPDYVNFKRRISYPTIFKNAIKKKIKLESLSEEMRILYVSLTRAKEKLIITGAVRDIEAASKNWAEDINSNEEKISENIILRGMSYLDWICPAVIKHEAGEVLREKADVSIEDNFKLSHESQWKIKLWTRDEIVKDNIILSENEVFSEDDTSSKVKLEHENKKLSKIEVLKNILSEIETKAPRTPYYEEIDRRLSWKYKYDLAKGLPSSVSVTELKRQQSSEDEYSRNIFPPVLKKRPVFLEERKGLTPAEKGTAMHAVMQRLDFSLPITKESIKSQMEKMIFKELITEKQAEAVDIKKIERFFQGEIGKRMLSSLHIEREIPFVIRLKACDVYVELCEEDYKDESMMLQGAIDCYFEEKDGLVLVDYKTDYVTDKNVKAVVDKYRNQLKYYSQALTKITGKKVKEQYLYLFYDGRVVKI